MSRPVEVLYGSIELVTGCARASHDVELVVRPECLDSVLWLHWLVAVSQVLGLLGRITKFGPVELRLFLSELLVDRGGFSRRRLVLGFF